MRVIGSIEPVPLKATDFNNDHYIGLKVFNHPKHGHIVLMESKENNPKRFIIVVENKNPIYFLSLQESTKHFNKMKST